MHAHSAGIMQHLQVHASPFISNPPEPLKPLNQNKRFQAIKYVCRRVDVKKAWAVHLAEQQQKQQPGSDAEEDQETGEAVDPAEVGSYAHLPVMHPLCVSVSVLQ